MKKRFIALLLAVLLVMSLAPQSFAASIDDYPSGVNVMIRSETPHTYLDITTGGYTWGLSARIWSYITADGSTTGPAYCINHGSGYPSGYIAVDTTPYTANPTMTAAFGSGFPLVSLETFTQLHPECAGLTRDEYGYATQLAVWAALSQLAIPGTSFTGGSETLVQPTDAAKMRVYSAVLAILDGVSGSSGTGNLALRVRINESSESDTVDLGADISLANAASEGSNGIRSETINGASYYTREFTVLCGTMSSSGSVTLSVADAPSGTILASTSNQLLSGNTLPLSASGSGYVGKFKLCIPTSAPEATVPGSASVRAAASVASCTYYMVDNSHAYEQNFIIADPNSSSSTGMAYLKWGETGTTVPETGSIRLLKTGDEGSALAGAKFDIDGSGGYHASGVTGSDGSITWTDLPVAEGYVITETVAPEGYQLTEPVNVSVKVGQTVYITITDSTEKVLRVHKQDKQSGFSLEGTLFRFEQINGSFVTEGRTKSDGMIELSPDRLPYGSYRVTEIAAPGGYERDTTVQTVNWDGSKDIDLYFTNVRKPGFQILKVDASTNTPLSGAVFEVYKDGALIDTVRSNEVGLATVSGVSEGYYEVVEIIAPNGYVLDSTRHGFHIDPANPATSADQVIRITNKQMPSLRILKYDAQTMRPLANVIFEVYKDTVLLGTYTTDSRGEIYLYDLEPGTYTAKEIAAPDTHIVNSTPQSIELEAGVTQTYHLIFFNYLKPGIHLKKVDSQTLEPLANVRFRITQVGGTFSQEYRTDANGEIDLTGLEPGSYTVIELEAPDGYLIDDAQRIIRIEGGDNAEFLFTNTKKPSMRLIKLDSLTGERRPGATYRIAKIADGSHYLDRVTDINGEILITDLEPGVYSVQEMAAPDGYVLDQTEFHVELFPGQTSQLVVSDDVKPDLRIVKKDAETGEYLDGAVFKVRQADGHTLTAEETNANGEIVLRGLQPGVYEITEQEPPVGYLPAREPSQLITLSANKLGTVIFSNYEKPTLTVNKISSVSEEPLQGAKFKVTYRSNNTETGAMQNLGNFLTDENGQFHLTDLTDGWYTITELESVTGYFIEEATQEVYIRGGEDKVLTFRNIPLSALVVYKYDSVSGEAVSGAVFQVKKLSDTSGSGGTVIGTYRTSVNGSFTVTGLAEGTYTVEELRSDSGHVIDTAPQTAYISGKQTDVVELYFGNSPKGSVLIRKIDSVTREPLADVEFLVTDSEGTLIGDANGKFVTDSAGSILIEGLLPSATLVVKETKAKDGYVMDTAPQTVKVRAGKTVTLEFRNASFGSLIIQKIDSKTKEPLAGAVFEVKTSSGEYVDTHGGAVSSNGRYTTDSNGQIVFSGLKPDTYVVTEIEAPDGYVLAAPPQTVRVNTNDTQTLTFGNPRKGSLLIQKCDSVTGAPLEGVKLQVKTSTGELVANNGGQVSSNGEYLTDANGQVFLTDLESATYIVTEIETISGYVLDTTPHSIVVKANDAQTLRITNKPKGSLVIEKLDSITREPLAGAEFRITTADGTNLDDNEGLTSSSGLYVTDENGQIYLTKLSPATYIITETKAPQNYKLAGNSKTVVVRAADTQKVTVTDDPLCTLTLLKRDAVTKKGLAGAEFVVKYSDGTEVGSNNGRYATGRDGTVVVSGLKPDATVIVTESRAPTGYVKDETPKSIVVRSGVANSLTFDDDPTTTLVIRKFIEGTANEPLAGVGFKVTSGDGAAVGPDDGVYYTDEAGEIVLNDLEPGTTVTAREIKTVDGFVLNGIPQDILIKSNQVQTLTFWNARKGSLTIRKLDSVTREPLAGVQFKVTYAYGRVVDTEDGKLSSNGIYETDTNGMITIMGITGTLVVTETKTLPGYTIDEGTRTQTVVVRPDDGQTLTFYNTPKQTLTIQKYITDTTTPIEGVEFFVTDSSGAVVGPNNGLYTTDENGRIVITGLVPGTVVTARETRAPSGFVLSSVSKNILIKEGDAQQLTFYNDRKGALIIRKLDSVDGTPLEGAKFLITTIAGAYVDDNEGATSTQGVYFTDENGEIRLLNLDPNTYVVKETVAPEGYVLAQKEQTVKVNANDTQTLTFLNVPKQTVIIQKFIDGTTEPLAGVTFLVTDGNNNPVGSANGEHTTDAHGQIVLTGLTPGMTLVAREIKTPKGYVLNGNTQTIIVGQDAPAEIRTPSQPTGGNTMTFYDEEMNSLTIRKFITGTDFEPLSGVAFKIVDGSGKALGTDDGVYYTDKAGEIVLLHIEPGTTAVVREIRTVDGFVLDGTPQDILIESGGSNQTLTFWNRRNQTLTIQKYVTGTTTPIEGVEFLVTDSSGAVVGPSNGVFTTDENGRIVIAGLIPGTVITARETKAPDGYVMSNVSKNILIKEGEAQQLIFYNDLKGGLIVRKLDSVDGKPLKGAKFLITTIDGTYVDDNDGKTSTKGVYVTDENGEIRLQHLAPNTYVVKETEAPDGYVLSGEEQTVKVGENDTQTLTFRNTPKQTVIIQKYVAGTTTPLPGVTFLVTDGAGLPVGAANGEHTTDENGRIVLTGLTPGTTLIVKEIRTPKGYVLNGSTQTIIVGQDGSATTVTPGQGGNTLIFYDEEMNSLTVRKYIAGTDYEPLSGVAFQITDGSGKALGTDDGIYYTNKVGEIVLLHLEPGTTAIVREVKTVDGYELDGTPQDILIESGGDNQTLTFWNARKGSLTIRKLDSVTKEPLAGVEFKITYADGRFVDNNNGHSSSNGIYTTNKNGEIIISGVTGTLVVTEERTIEGYTIDEGTRTQTVTVNPDDGQVLTFYNTPIGGVELIKVNAAKRSERIPNTTFEIRRMDDALVATVTTDKYGRAFAALDEGSYYAVEIVAADGYKLDSTPTYFEVKAGNTTTKTITNEKFSGITIHKTDSQTGQGIYGVTFVLYNASKTPIEQMTTDQYGYAWTSKELSAGQYFLRELEAAEGYLPDTQYKTVFVEAGRNTTVEWQNTPVTAQIQVIKYAGASNTITGQAKGSVLQGAVYEIVRERSGVVVGHITTDARGIAASPGLPLGRYIVREVSAPAYWQLSEQKFDVTLEYAGQIIKLIDYDQPAELGVSITKTGNASVMAGTSMTYKISVANTSNVPLESFFWHDRIPTDVATATVLTTGTYSARLNYRILYRTNYNQTYQVLASNLLTSNSYSFSLNAIPTQAGEKVTDVYFDFGKVPVGFQSVTGPTLSVYVAHDAANGYQMVNRADAGGKYQETWQTATAGWVTGIVSFYTPPVLPKTGY